MSHYRELQQHARANARLDPRTAEVGRQLYGVEFDPYTAHADQLDRIAEHIKTRLCHCGGGENYSGGARLGHVHAAKISSVEWARGICAMAELAGDSKVPWLADLPRAVRQARAILRKEPR